MNAFSSRINRLHRLTAGAIAVLLVAAASAQPARRGAAGAAGAAGAGAAGSFDSFQLIGSLNIFNSSRIGPVDDSVQPHIDTISLVGTMEYKQGRLAFFDSSDAIYRKAVRVGEKIAEYTVTRIETAGVELTRDAKKSSMAMGQQLRRPPGGDWALGNAPPAQAAQTGAAADAPIPADVSDIVKKMMENRQKQLKQ